ncbi:MAG: hypothetical protein Q9165_001756 [Trypethelium subeluteriae]
MAGMHRVECRARNANREDSAQSTIVTSVNPSSKNTIYSTAATDDGKSNVKTESARPIQEPMPVNAPAQSRTNGAGRGNVDPSDSSRHGILGLRKALSRTGAFVKGVCQADISDARGVNAYLDKSRSRDGETLDSPLDLLSVEDVEAARKEWLAFSCSNTPGNRTPVEEKEDPLAGAQIEQHTLGSAGGQTDTTTDQTSKSAKRKKNPSESSSVISPPRPLTYDPSLLSSLLAATRAYYRAQLLERYSAYLTCRVGKHSHLHLLRSPSPAWDVNWALVSRELEAESATLERWEHERTRRDSKGVFSRRGRSSSSVVGPRPKTPWLDGMEEELRLASERDACESPRPKLVCAWIKAYIKMEKASGEKCERQGDVDNASREGDRHVDDHEDEDEHDHDHDEVHEGEEDEATDNENLLVGPGWIEELVEDCAFDVLARRLKDDAQLVLWAFNTGSSSTDHEKEEDRALQREIDQAIKNAQREWFTSVFVQPACPLDGQRSEIPARVFKIISEKAKRRVKRRAKGASRRERGLNGRSSEMPAQCHVEDAAGQQEEQGKEEQDRDEI